MWLRGLKNSTGGYSLDENLLTLLPGIPGVLKVVRTEISTQCKTLDIEIKNKTRFKKWLPSS